MGMKQHITIEQLNELSKEKRMNLERWCFEKRYFTRHTVPGEPARFSTTDTFESFTFIPIELSIGQMIEFLHDHKIHYLTALECEWPNYDCDYNKFFKAQDICDALWEKVKEI